MSFYEQITNYYKNYRIMTEYQFIQPVRRILTQKDLHIFTESTTRAELVGFVEGLNSSVKGPTNDADVETDEVSMMS